MREIGFPLLEDQEHKVTDKAGRVRWKFIETDYKGRPANAAILDALAAAHEAQKKNGISLKRLLAFLASHYHSLSAKHLKEGTYERIHYY